MDEPQQERALRAARNQAMFRLVNETTEELGSSLDGLFRTHTVVCECADVACLERLEISREDYLEVRRHPRRFVVLHGHVCPEVEQVVVERGGYVVVEKGAVAEAAVEAHARGL